MSNTKDNGEWNATPKKQKPLNERLDSISVKMEELSKAQRVIKDAKGLPIGFEPFNKKAMDNTKDTPMDYKPLITIAMQEYADKQNASLKLELQKQKELNAELVSACKYLKGTLTSDRLKCEQPDAIEKLESLIKKSSEI